MLLLLLVRDGLFASETSADPSAREEHPDVDDDDEGNNQWALLA